MRTILGAFRGSPATQTSVQILAAAATARHFGGENSATARKWEKLAQDNAARLDVMRAQRYLQGQTRYVQAQMAPEEIDRCMAERAAADLETDRRAFDAAGALALSYVAVKSLPPFDKLAGLSANTSPPSLRHLPPTKLPPTEEQTPGPQTEEITKEATSIPESTSPSPRRPGAPPPRPSGAFRQTQQPRAGWMRTSPTSSNR